MKKEENKYCRDTK